MVRRYVLDASAGVDILQHTPEGQTLALAVRGDQNDDDDEPELWTVEHFHVEVTKVIRRDTLAGVLDDQHATQLVETLAEWPLSVVSVAPLLAEAWQLRHNLTIHDALYVVVTRRLENATLVTSDTKLPNAPGVDIAVITPDQLSA